MASNLSLAETKNRIRMQEEAVQSLVPGTPHHHIATNTLLLLQDSLYVLTEAHEMIQHVRLAAAKESSAA